jgi:DNA repair protein RadD
VQTFILEPFQQQASSNIKQLLCSVARVLLQSATGSGKTVIAADFAADYLKESANHKILCLVNLQALVGQFYTTMTGFNVPVSVLHDEITRAPDGTRYTVDWSRRFLLTMPETFLNAQAGLNKLGFDPDFVPTLILIDEAHKGTSLQFQMIRELYPNAKVVGLTATPYRDKNKEGESLHEWYGENLITTVSVADLIEMGRLVQPIYFSLDSDSHVVESWQKHTQGSAIKNTIVFTRDTKHSFALKEAFLAAGITAEVITAGTDTDPDFYVTPQTPLQRQAIYNDYDAGRIQVLISVTALCEGFDSPAAKFCFLCRGVGNPALFQQMIGRVLRAYEGKGEAVIVDFHGNIETHGHIEHYVWNLDVEKPDTSFCKDRTSMSLESFTRKSSVYYRCDSCNHVYDIKRNARCGHCDRAHPIKLTSKLGDLIQVNFSLTHKEFDAFKTDMVTAFSDSAFVADFKRKQINKKYGVIFGDAGLLEQYQYLANVANSNWSDVIEMAA